MYFIENEFLKIEVSSIGAELFSIYDKKKNVEYLWQGNPVYWKRRAPVLFPIVGNLKDDSYIYNGIEYSMNQHGFARDKEFKCIYSDKEKIRFKLLFDEDSLKKYPFKFELDIEYILTNKKLDIKYSINNIDNKNMFYSIGGHPGFNCPVFQNENFDDYYLEFGEDTVFESYAFTKDLSALKNDKILVKHKDNLISLDYDLFAEDAIILDQIKCKKVKLKSLKNNDFGIELNFDDFSYLGIWTKGLNAPFICIEPWNGIKDFEFHNGELDSKVGIRNLNPGNTESFIYNIIVD